MGRGRWERPSVTISQLFFRHTTCENHTNKLTFVFLFLFSFFVCLFIVKSNKTNQIVLKPLNSVLNICSILHIFKFSNSQVCQDVYEKWENWSFRIKYIESCVKYCRSTSAPNLVCRRIPISNLSPPREILSFRGSILVAWHHHHDQCMTQEKVAFTITCQIFTLFIFFPRLHKFCNHTSYLSFSLHRQNFRRRKFTPKFTQ